MKNRLSIPSRTAVHRKAVQSGFWGGALIATIAATAQSPAPEPVPIGKMVDLGGYRIHLDCPGKGKQTIVLSPGGGDFSFVWYLVQQQVQTFARVCSFDRAGYAWSDPGSQPLTFRQEAYELDSTSRISSVIRLLNRMRGKHQRQLCLHCLFPRLNLRHRGRFH